MLLTFKLVLFQDLRLHSKEENINLIYKSVEKPFNPLQSNISFIDKSPIDPPAISNNVHTAKTLPRTIKNGKGIIPGKMFASPEDSKLSASSLSQTSRNYFNSPEFKRDHFRQLSGYKYKLHKGQSVSSDSSTDDSFYRKSPREEPVLFAKGIKRSEAFHTAELLQKQVTW